MNKYHCSASSGGTGAPASLAGGALDWPGAPPAWLPGAPLLPLLPLLPLQWYFIHRCSLVFLLFFSNK